MLVNATLLAAGTSVAARQVCDVEIESPQWAIVLRNGRDVRENDSGLGLFEDRPSEQGVLAALIELIPDVAEGVRATADSVPSARSDQPRDGCLAVAQPLCLTTKEDTVPGANGTQHVLHARDAAPPESSTGGAPAICGQRSPTCPVFPLLVGHCNEAESNGRSNADRSGSVADAEGVLVRDS